MRTTLIVTLLAILAITVTSKVLYTRNRVPTGWVKGHSADLNEPIEFTLALKQRNLDVLDKMFWEVSDPKHANYQEFLGIDQILDIVAPKSEDEQKVLNWLINAGVHKHNIKNMRDAMDVKTTVYVASKLFSTKFFTYKHVETGAKIVRNFGQYSVPDNMKDLVDMVTGISAFPIPHLTTKRVNASNDYAVVSQTIDALYNIPASYPRHHHDKKNAAGDGTSTGVIEFQGQNFAPADVAQYGTDLGLQVQAVPQNQIVGPNDPTNPQTEAELDIEMITTVNTITSPWFWLENGNGWLYQFATHFFSTAAVPQVNSISYGWWEGDQCSIDQDECSQLGVDSYGYVNRVNTEFQKIALRGISLLSASGDSGANGRTDGECTVPRLRPAFPGASPFVTTVGATQLNNPVFNLPAQPAACTTAGYQCPSGGQEVAVSFAVSSFASGGGFSDAAVMPSYQTAAVNAYFTSGVQLPPASYFNASSRGFPDVAAQGHNNLIDQSGQLQPVGGTSASTPIWASIISMLNAVQIQKTGKPLGFLNPFLYQLAASTPQAFQDITVGDNICTEDGCSSTCQGYYCAKGWDPVTGLGSPNVGEMLKALQAMEYPNKKKTHF
jgi:tripeptidyl-peptidase-1